jgi:hypothetical protein
MSLQQFTKSIAVTSPSLGTHTVLVDRDDLLLIEKHNGLYIRKSGQFIFVRTRKGKIPLHRLVTNCPKGMVVDHLNRNPLDNRKSNLKICTIQENLRNQFRPDNTSGYRGVYKYRFDKSKYVAAIKHNYKYIHLGVFRTIDEAIKARKKAEVKYWGREYAV